MPAVVSTVLLVLLVVLVAVLANRGKSTSLQSVTTTSTEVPTTQPTTTSSTRPTTTTRPVTTTATPSTTAPAGDQIVTLSQAESLVHSQGYATANSDGFTNDNVLKVILATATGSADGYQKRAFFFADSRYLGNDTKDPSAGISLSDQTNDTVTLQYAIYAPGDPLGSPSQPPQSVRFRYDGTKLTALDPIPGHRSP